MTAGRRSVAGENRTRVGFIVGAMGSDFGITSETVNATQVFNGDAPSALTFGNVAPVQTPNQNPKDGGGDL